MSKPEDAEDEVGLVVIPAEQLKQHYEQVRAEQARVERRVRLDRIGRASVLATALASNAVLAGTVWWYASTKEIVPLIVYLRDDGTITTVLEWTQLPSEIRKDVTVNTLWSYVENRESWSDGNASRAYQTVSGLSAKREREKFQAWYDADNPDSPARQYKDGTTVTVVFKGFDPVCPFEGCNGPPNAYNFRFDRIENPPTGKPKAPVRWSATVKFMPVQLPKDRVAQRWTINPNQILVTEYNSMREGVAK